MERERSSPQFSFLFPEKSKQGYIYYKWKVYSLMQGDTAEKWLTSPFRMSSNGPLWYPPPCPFIHLFNVNEKNTTSVTKKLSERNQKRLQSILDDLTLERDNIMTGMGFALDHSYAAQQIVSEISKRMFDESNHQLAQTLALLFLISDILFNASTASLSIVPDGPKFRMLFLDELNIIFPHVDKISKHDHFFREEMVKICDIWTKWSAFDVYKIDEWRGLFK
jgi:U2-associated protein SR140